MSDIDDLIYAPLDGDGYTFAGEMIICKHCGSTWKSKELRKIGHNPLSSMSCNRRPNDCALIAYAKGKD